jgi:membrane protein
METLKSLLNEICFSIKNEFQSIKSTFISTFIIISFFYVIGELEEIDFLKKLMADEIIVNTIFIFIVISSLSFWFMIDWHNKNKTLSIKEQPWFKFYKLLDILALSYFSMIFMNVLISSLHSLKSEFNTNSLIYLCQVFVLLLLIRLMPIYSYKDGTNAVYVRGAMVAVFIIVLGVSFVTGLTTKAGMTISLFAVTIYWLVKKNFIS